MLEKDALTKPVCQTIHPQLLNAAKLPSSDTYRHNKNTCAHSHTKRTSVTKTPRNTLLTQSIPKIPTCTHNLPSFSSFLFFSFLFSSLLFSLSLSSLSSSLLFSSLVFPSLHFTSLLFSFPLPPSLSLSLSLSLSSLYLSMSVTYMHKHQVCTATWTAQINVSWQSILSKAPEICSTPFWLLDGMFASP